MHNWKQSVVRGSTTIRDTIRMIDASAMQIALVVDNMSRLIGTVTDGDVRRAILRGTNLEAPVESIMNPRPTTATINESRDGILLMMRQKQLHQIPILDEEGRLVGVEIMDDLLQPVNRQNQVVIMAGGLGSRLRPLTDECPKPMLRVGDKPILETILENFIEYGFSQFHFSVNYKSDMIKEHFGDGSEWNVKIRYLEEEQQLGTAGALRLLVPAPRLPLIVMNGDLLTKINFQHLLDFHASHNAAATMCVREYEQQIPYGMVSIEGHRLVGVKEKPAQKFFVNAGIYVLNPGALDYLPAASAIDMPDLFNRVMDGGGQAAVFPLREYWLDIGRIDDLERARNEYEGKFAP
ncbi:MAG: nucleotidyltransferase family protein [Betaproteobacteria bacterium]|nr:nucleotidyltransferase family protein [Betaproteobacteria bacterium]